MPIALVFFSLAAGVAVTATVLVRQAAAMTEHSLAGLSITLPAVL